MAKDATLPSFAGDRTSSLPNHDDLMDVIVRELKKSGKFTLPRVGTFTVRDTRARKGVTRRAGGTVKATASKTVQFKASRLLAKAIETTEPPERLGDALCAGFARSVDIAITEARAAGLAVPGRENGSAVELQPDGRVRKIEDPDHWSPVDWKG
jgi:nucleoid DNA-binding protein